MAHSQFDTFLREATHLDPRSESTLYRDSLYGLFLSDHALADDRRAGTAHPATMPPSSRPFRSVSITQHDDDGGATPRARCYVFGE